MFKSRKQQLHFYLIFPNIFNFKGGIQVYSAFLLEVLRDLYPDAIYDIFLKYDHCFNLPESFEGLIRFHYFGRFPRSLQSLLLGLHILVQGLRQRPLLLITTHINYSIPCYYLWKISKIPYWIIAHGDEVWNLKHPLRQAALREAQQVIAVSHYTRQRLLAEQNLRPSQVSVLSNTFDADRFQITSKPAHLLKKYGLTSQQPVILTVSRLGRTAAPYKGYYQVIQALPQILQQIPNAHYLLVGKGDALPEIEQLVHQLDLEDHVTLTGFIPDEALSSYYNLCDVFALPSSIEGFGIVYLEALACGKPVLAGNQDGAVDPLDHGKYGCLVNPADIDEIAHNLVQILQGSYPNSLLYQPQQLRQHAVDSFSQEQFENTLAQLLQTQFKLTNKQLEK
ncbi:MAG: glycosyltransferase [Microcoleaceae cyanobacterium]